MSLVPAGTASQLEKPVRKKRRLDFTKCDDCRRVSNFLCITDLHFSLHDVSKTRVVASLHLIYFYVLYLFRARTQDKQKCLPIEREFPAKCFRCVQKGFSCSEGHRAKSKVVSKPVDLEEAPDLVITANRPQNELNNSNRNWYELCL
jgi:hypothetical protein